MTKHPAACGRCAPFTSAPDCVMLSFMKITGVPNHVPARSFARHAMSAAVVTGALIVGSLTIAPPANAMEFVTVSGEGSKGCNAARTAKITQLKKLKYTFIDAGGCAQFPLSSVWIAKIAYRK